MVDFWYPAHEWSPLSSNLVLLCYPILLGVILYYIYYSFAMMFCRLYYLCIAIIVLQYTGGLSLSFLHVQCTATDILKLHLKTWQIVVGLTLSVPIHSQWNASFVLLFLLSILIGGFKPPKTYQLSVSWITLIGLKHVEFSKKERQLHVSHWFHILYKICIYHQIYSCCCIIVLYAPHIPRSVTKRYLEISSN